MQNEEEKTTQELMDMPNYENELIEIINSNLSDMQLSEALSDYHENDIAGALEKLNTKQRHRLYRILDPDTISDIFSYLENVSQYIEELHPQKAADIIENMDADDAVDLLEEIEEGVREHLIDLMDAESQEDIRLIRSYDESQVGSIMTTNYVHIGRGLSVRQAMKALVTQAAENDNISTIYVVDQEEKFYGAIELKDLIVAREYTELEDIISTSYPFVQANEEISHCLERLKEYAEDSIPVVDDSGILIGVITAQNLLETVDEEMSDDYAKFAGLTAEEDLNESLLESMKKRLPWLVALLGLGMVVSTVVGLFENVVSEITMIVAFQSLILGMAGNVGTQSLAVTIRVLMDENLTGRQKLGLAFKEMRVGLSNGVLLGILSFFVIGAYVLFMRGKPPIYAFGVSGCVGIALAVAMLVSSLVGTVIPMFFHKIKVDPAVASGPLITTVNDLVAVITYYGLAWLLLLNFLHISG